MDKHHCQRPGCFRPCEVTVRLMTEEGGEVDRIHLCGRHHEVLLAEAARRKLPAIDKRVTRRG